MADVEVTPSVVNIEVVAGTDVTIEVQLTDAVGVPVDITADTVDFTVRTSKGGAQKQFSSNGPGGHSDPVNGKTRFSIARATTAGLCDTDWVYEVRRIVGGSGDEAVYIEGILHNDEAVGKGA